MQDIAFYIFAALTLLCGFLVVFNPLSRNPVTSAMFLVLTIISMAGLFVLLNAFFLAAVQILVYAGAVLVVFVFVIMLLDLKEEERRKVNIIGVGLGILSVALIFYILVFRVFTKAGLNEKAVVATVEGDTKSLGMILFKNYLLPFEVLSLLLLVGVVGAILLSKKDLK